METGSKQMNEQVEKLSYLESKREMNLQILQTRIKEIEEKNTKNKVLNSLNKAALSF